MESFPHPTLPGVFVTTPVYVGLKARVSEQCHCSHLFPEGLPDNMDESPDGKLLMGIQQCSLCGASRAIYKPK